MSVINLALRLFQLLMTVLVMALTGNEIAMGANSAVNNYVLFCSAWALLFLLWQTPASVKESLIFVPIAMLAVDVLTTIFWFCGAVALAAELHVHSCNNYFYRSTNQVIRGASDQFGACREAQASTAFLWFGFAAFVGSTVFSGLGLGKSGVSSGGIRRGPAMSQV